MGCIHEPAIKMQLARRSLHHVGIMYTAFTGYMLINVLMLICRGIGDRIPYKTSILFSVNGAALFLITAILLLVNRSIFDTKYNFPPNTYQLTMITTSVCFAFSNVIVFAIDAFFTCRKRLEF